MERVDVSVTGGCQCGAIRYRSTAMMDNAHLCHCRMCQKAVGNLFAALVGAPKDALVWTRGQPATFRSSDNAERGFCAQCGTPLFYHELTANRIGLTIGSLDRPQDFPPIDQVGTEARMPWFDSLPQVPEPPEGGTTDAGDQGPWAAAIQASNRQHPDHDTTDWPAAS